MIRKTNSGMENTKNCYNISVIQCFEYGTLKSHDYNFEEKSKVKRLVYEKGWKYVVFYRMATSNEAL